MAKLECQICLEEFNNNHYFLYFPCDHHFCYICCLEMFYQEQGEKCPLCRKKLVEAITMDNYRDVHNINLCTIQQIKHLKPTLGRQIVLNHLLKRFNRLPTNNISLQSYQLIFEKIKILLVVGSGSQKINILNFLASINKKIDSITNPTFWDDYASLLQEVITLLPGLHMDTKLEILSWISSDPKIILTKYNLLLKYLDRQYPDFIHNNIIDNLNEDKYYQEFINECNDIYLDDK